MIAEFSSLCRVKELREERLLLEVEARRRAVRDAECRLEEARKRVADNAALLEQKERNIFGRLIGKTSTTKDFEAARERVKRLEQGHQRIVDEERQIEHELGTLRDELSALRERHRRSMAERDKYQMTKQLLEDHARRRVEAAEEIELEEVAGPRPVPLQ